MMAKREEQLENRMAKREEQLLLAVAAKKKQLEDKLQATNKKLTAMTNKREQELETKVEALMTQKEQLLMAELKSRDITIQGLKDENKVLHESRLDEQAARQGAFVALHMKAASVWEVSRVCPLAGRWYAEYPADIAGL
jgi:hypothetical protein